jgi:hypothetical protein
MINGATATVVNEADSRLFYKTFDGKFIPYLIEGEGGGGGGGIDTETDPVYTKDKPYIALKSELPTKLSQLTNDKNFITGYTETDPVYTKDKPNIALKSELPTKLSQLTNDKNFITSYTETDPVYTKDKPNIALKSELFKPTTTGEGTKFLADNGDYMPVNVEPPEKGVDYWTEADKTEIKNELKQYVDDELLNGVY